MTKDIRFTWRIDRPTKLRLEAAGALLGVSSSQGTLDAIWERWWNEHGVDAIGQLRLKADLIETLDAEGAEHELA